MRWARLVGVISSLKLSRRTLSTQREDPPFPHGDKLDFMTAAKILFTTPPKPKKFGIDFHLVQFFFACLPSLAVYLVAQYARYDIRKREAELEMKKRAEEETKETGLDSKTAEAGQDLELAQVKMRLIALEETVKEIVDKTKKAIPQKGEDQSPSKSENVASPGRNDKDSSAVANFTTTVSSTEPKASISASTVQESVVKSASSDSAIVQNDAHKGKKE